jgi:formylglycine-generating enzyme required for sulfatase activity
MNPPALVRGWQRFALAAPSVLLFAAPFSFGSNIAPPDQATHSAAQTAEPGSAAVAANRVVPDLNLELIWIKPGTFTMGSPLDEVGRNKAEGPQMQVTLTKGFWLGKTEVTQAQYEAVTGTNPSRFKEMGKDAPVEEVSWDDAKDYCQKLTERERAAGRLPEGYVYTVPTEAQWEYACRAGTTGVYAGPAESMAWYADNGGGTTHPVATKQPNAWGLYDMYGNVLEWCLDWYGDYSGGAVTDWSGPRHGYFRMARGGSWRMPLFRSASRAGGSQGRRDYTIGFRLALSAVK